MPALPSRSAHRTACSRRAPPRPRAAPGRALRLSRGQVITQHDGAVVKRVVRAIEEGYWAVLPGFEDRLPGVRVRIQLVPVATPKFFPSLHSVVEPLSQLCTGRDVLHPFVHRENLLLHAPGPQALDQDSTTVAPCGQVVRPLDPDHGRSRTRESKHRAISTCCFWSAPTGTTSAPKKQNGRDWIEPRREPRRGEVVSVPP
jgi:hypothetical protein